MSDRYHPITGYEPYDTASSKRCVRFSIDEGHELREAEAGTRGDSAAANVEEGPPTTRFQRGWRNLVAVVSAGVGSVTNAMRLPVVNIPAY